MWNMARNQKSVENEKHTLLELKFGEKTEKRGQ